MGFATDRFLRGESVGLGPSLLRAPLIPLAILYGCGSALNLMWRRRRPRPVLPVPVISVGNLEVGGTGKTPFVRWLAGFLRERGEIPLIVTRSYGKLLHGGVHEEQASLQADGFLVVHGKNRTEAAARGLIQAPEVSVVVFDDGAQTLSDHRDLNLFLLDARRPFGSGWPLPAGSLREFAGGLRRADALLITRGEDLQTDQWEALESRLVRRASKPIIRLQHRARSLLPGGRDPLELRGRRVHLLAGIARPASFEALVTSLGADIVGSSFFPDHHSFSRDNLATAVRAAKAEGAEWVLATGKDLPKLIPWQEDGVSLHALEVDVAPTEDRRAELEVLLVRTLRLRRGSKDHGT